MNAKRILIIGSTILAIVIICCIASCKKDVYIYSESPNIEDSTNCPPNKEVQKAKLKFYLECSASMNGYMDHSGKFKDAINECLSMLHASGNFDTIQLNYIGKNVHLFNPNFELNQTESLLNQFLNPSYYEYNKTNISHLKDGKNKKSGITFHDRNYSKLSEILDTVIGRTKEDVSVLVSDCIFDPYEGQPEYYLSLCKTDIYNLFQIVLKKYPNLAVQIIQLNSKFVGSYYYKVSNPDLENTGKKSITESIPLNGEVRPYYIWIIANRNSISKFNDKLNRLAEHNENQELIHSVIFAPKNDINIEINTNNPNGKLSEKDGIADFKIVADMGDLLIDDISWITNKDNYILESRKARKDEITIYGDIEYDSLTKKITLPIKLTKVKPDIETTIKLKSKKGEMPQWVNDVNGINAKNDAKNRKTTGIKSIIEGVANAYSDFNGDYMTEFKICTTTDKSDVKKTSTHPKDKKKQKQTKQSKEK